MDGNITPTGQDDSDYDDPFQLFTANIHHDNRVTQNNDDGCSDNNNSFNNNSNSDAPSLVSVPVCASSFVFVSDFKKTIISPCVLTVVFKTWFNGWATERRMRGKAPLSTISACKVYNSCHDELEHLIICPVACQLGVKFLGLFLDKQMSVEQALLFEIRNLHELAARALHLFAIFVCRFSLKIDLDRTYTERIRKALSLHLKLGRMISIR